MAMTEFAASHPGTTVLQVSGITCLDCAAKFERAVKSLPGVEHASLNTMTGRLTIAGTADLAAIRRLGRDENYTITPLTPSPAAAAPLPKPRWELRRAVLSGVALAAAFVVEKCGGSGMVYLPLYIAAMVLGGWGNFRQAAGALPRLNFNMSVLMSMAIIGAVAIGRYEEGASVAFLYAISEMLEGWTMAKGRHAVSQLLDMAPPTARLRRGDDEVEVPVADVAVDDIMIVRPGEKIPLDGVIVSGESAVNEAAITGEAIPAEKGPGMSLYAGTLNTVGALTVRVTKLAQDTTIAKIIHMVEEAQSRRAPSQVFIEKFAAVYTPLVMALAVGIVFIPPLTLGQAWAPWIYRGLALLVVACPCALVVSTPVAIVSAVSTAARNGVLIKGGVYLEAAGSLNAMAFDKTGTLTTGEPAVTDIIPLGDMSADQLLAMAAGLEGRSEHPLAAAIVRAARERGLSFAPAQDFTALTGRGGRGTVAGQVTYIGSPRLFHELAVDTGPMREEIARLEGQGKTVLLVGTPSACAGLIALADTVRASSAAAIAALKRVGVRNTVMLTGDNAATARVIAARVGVDDYRAALLPQDKVTALEELLHKFGRVAMVGDGVNDAPALARATVGIAMGGAGTDTALETADIVLMADDLRMLPFTIRLSRYALHIIRQNIGLAIVIKLLAVLAVFPGWLTLWLAIMADMGASILVTLNSLRLMRAKAL